MKIKKYNENNNKNSNIYSSKVVKQSNDTIFVILFSLSVILLVIGGLFIGNIITIKYNNIIGGVFVFIGVVLLLLGILKVTNVI